MITMPIVVPLTKNRQQLRQFVPLPSLLALFRWLATQKQPAFLQYELACSILHRPSTDSFAMLFFGTR